MCGWLLCVDRTKSSVFRLGPRSDVTPLYGPFSGGGLISDVGGARSVALSGHGASAAGGAVVACSAQNKLVGTSGYAESHGLEGVWKGSLRQDEFVEGCSGQSRATRRSNSRVSPDWKNLSGPAI